MQADPGVCYLNMLLRGMHTLSGERTLSDLVLPPF